MLSRFSLSVVATLAVALLVWPAGLGAANDPSIQGQLRADIQASMRHFIDERASDGVYLHYDAATGELLTLKFKELHSGIVKKGDFYVSCADFTDSTGKLFDLDFLIRAVEDKLQTSQAIVHAVGGKKRAYHLESK